MYRATLIFSYSFWGIILTFWYPIPLPQLTRGVFPAPFGSLYPLRADPRGISCLFRLSIPSLG